MKRGFNILNVGAFFECFDKRINSFAASGRGVLLASLTCGESGGGVVSSPLFGYLHRPGWRFYYYSLEEKRCSIARSPCCTV